MFLENYAGRSGEILGEGVFVGDQSEQMEVMAECSSGMHNLVMAMARFEHRAIIESTGAEVMEEAVKDFFTKAKDIIVTA